MSQNNSHPAQNSPRVRSLPDDLKSSAQKLIAKKFDLPKEGEIVEKEGEIPALWTPRVTRDPGRHAVDISCGKCGFRFRSIGFQHMQQQAYMQQQLGNLTSALSGMPSGTVQFIQEICPYCNALNQGQVYVG